MMLKITANTDIRTFKKDDTIELQFADGLCVIVGENGSGKSTITHAIKGNFVKNNKAKFVGNSLNNSDISSLSKCFDIESDYDYCYSVDFHLDNPLASNNSYDAVEFLMNGGHATQHKSHGECQFYMLGRVIQQLEQRRKSHSTEKVLLILDEPECGLSIPKQFKMSENMIPGLIDQG